jgi:hypothetical protein
MIDFRMRKLDTIVGQLEKEGIMYEFDVVVRSALEVWPFWLFVCVVGTVVWKMPKTKGKRVCVNPAETLNNDVFAQFTGMPGSNGAVSPFSSSNHD